jgi:hypothetical protein
MGLFGVAQETARVGHNSTLLPITAFPLENCPSLSKGASDCARVSGPVELPNKIPTRTALSKGEADLGAYSNRYHDWRFGLSLSKLHRGLVPISLINDPDFHA